MIPEDLTVLKGQVNSDRGEVDGRRSIRREGTFVLA